jgi:two-component system, OmpR family, sensor histidine kinase ChvG
MAWGTALVRSDGSPSRRTNPDDQPLNWSARWSLTSRILAVNIFAVAMLAGSFAYLDSYRTRVAEERTEQAEADAQMIGTALAAVPAEARTVLATKLAGIEGERVRVYDESGKLALDSWRNGPITYRLIDPETQPWRKHAARFMDRSFDHIVGADKFPDFIEPASDVRDAWPEAQLAARHPDRIYSMHRNAPDRTPVLSAAIRVPGVGTVLTTNNVRDITRIVRAERFAIGLVIGAVLIVSVLLSLFLARTIARPLRRLAFAAHRVRLGRAREVVVPRLPSRRDEIGLLARALSDMSQALRRRIDAVEAFAADVSHELKNPLASLRSAVDSLSVVKDPALQGRLLDIVRDDVVRLDRLITDVAEISRLDGELSRAHFEAIDLGPLVQAMVAARDERGRNGDVRVAFARPYVDTAVVFGDGSRLARMVENLIDNAVSFSPPGGLVEVSAIGIEDIVLIAIEDEGPGIPPEKRDAIFHRFHTDRPDAEEPERHSGLGLAIAKAIADGHDGTIEVRDRSDGRSGAHFLITLPRAREP